jgi:hypothetical protein
MSQETLYEDSHINSTSWDPDKHIIHGGRNEALVLKNQGDFSAGTLVCKAFPLETSQGALVQPTVSVVDTDSILIEFTLLQTNQLLASGLTRCWLALDIDFGGTIGLRPIRQGYVKITAQGTNAALISSTPLPIGVIQKTAVSGTAHPVYTNALTMANGDTEATIPGGGTISNDNMAVYINGQRQTDFTFAVRTVTLGFTPSLNDQNRMVVDYEQY